MLNPVNADNFLFVINPIKNPPVANSQLAKAGQIIRHPDQAAMNHDGGIFRKPENLALDAGTDGGIQSGKLRVSLRAYFDPVGHDKCFGFQALNPPATSSFLASRNSAMTSGFCAVSQS